MREADCVLPAGVPCDIRLDYGKHVRRAATLISANRSFADARLNRRPSIAVIGDYGPTLMALAEHGGSGASRADWGATLRARADEREHEIDAQAATRGDYVTPRLRARGGRS